MFGKQIVYTPIPTGITVQSFDLDGRTHLYITKKDGANCIEWRRHFIVKEVLDDVLQHEGLY